MNYERYVSPDQVSNPDTLGNDLPNFVKTLCSNAHEELGNFHTYQNLYQPKLAHTLSRLLASKDPLDQTTLRYVEQLLASEAICLLPQSGQVTVYQPGESQSYPAEIYGLFDKPMYIRAGRLHCIDTTLRNNSIFSVFQPPKDNIISIHEMGQTEFSSTLGYFTLNCLIALQHLNLEGKVIVDCGSGSGVLSLAAKALGATAVVGIDHDPQMINQANNNRSIQKASKMETVRFIHMDLQQHDQIVKLLEPFKHKELVMVSNLGYWSRTYDIDNTTTLSLTRTLAKRGMRVTAYLGGGYSGNDVDLKNLSSSAIKFLSECGVQPKNLSSTDYDFDQKILTALGLKVTTRIASQPLRYFRGLFARIHLDASSLIATN